MNIGETMICLAKSRKQGGVCIAGKAVSPGRTLRWIRPVSRSESGTLSFGCIQPRNADSVELLDVLQVPVNGRDSRYSYQRENIFIDPSTKILRWESVPFGFKSLAFLEDSPESLWIDGYNSAAGLNDHVPERATEGLDSSLLLIRPSKLRLLVKEYETGIRYRALFEYRGRGYNLRVTDLRFDRMPPSAVRALDTRNAWLTISLGLPFTPPQREGSSSLPYRACYKLAAAVFLRGFFE